MEEHVHDIAVLSRPISHGLCKTPHFEHLTRSQPTKQLRSSHMMRMIGCFARKDCKTCALVAATEGLPPLCRAIRATPPP